MAPLSFVQEGHINKALFVDVAQRVNEIMGESYWQLSTNNCGHLVNYLLTSVHENSQSEKRFWRRVFGHLFGAFLEYLSSCLTWISYIGRFSVTFLLWLWLNDNETYYLWAGPPIFASEFLLAAFDVIPLIWLEKSRTIGMTMFTVQVGV